MASTLYILLPSKAMARELPDWSKFARPFALISEDGTILQQGQQILADLKGLAANARQISLLLAASDVSLINVKVPPMSATKLKTALPNLLEDQLLSDPAELILHSTVPAGGMCTIAAVDRSWMESLHDQMKIFGTKKLTAYALSMTMRSASDAMYAIITLDEKVIELAFRPAGKTGAGLTFNPDVNIDSQTEVVQQVLQTLSLFGAESGVNVLLPSDQLTIYQQVSESDSVLAQRFHFQAVEWNALIANLSSSTLDLMSSVSHANQSSFDWRRWRWSLGLAAAILLINLTSLNFQWLSMKREARGLSDSLTQIFRTSFPKESVILDPIAQMQQKINLSRKFAGLSTPDDFLVLAAQFGQVWDAVTSGKQASPSVVSMEYREHNLFVKIKSSGLLSLEPFKAGLQEHSLVLVSSTDGILQIRPGRGESK